MEGWSRLSRELGPPPPLQTRIPGPGDAKSSAEEVAPDPRPLNSLSRALDRADAMVLGQLRFNVSTGLRSKGRAVWVLCPGTGGHLFLPHCPPPPASMACLCQTVKGGAEGPWVLVGSPPMESVDTKAQVHTVIWGQSWGLQARPPHPCSVMAQKFSSV